MLKFDEIKKQYPDSLHKFDRGLLREYLQYQILGILFKHKYGRKLSFLGGTCLRIVYKTNRFSEDLDFDNKSLTEYEFRELSKYLQIELGKMGYEVEIKMVTEKAFHCYIKFPDLLYKEGLSPLKGEKILIQLDTFDQGVEYKTKIFILDKFDLFDQIIVTPKEIILSQKLWTITKRRRLKGRDFYDIMSLLQNTKPDKDFLGRKFGITDLDTIKRNILEVVSGVDWDEVVDDVSPFLHKIEDAEKIRLFPSFLSQVDFE